MKTVSALLCTVFMLVVNPAASAQQLDIAGISLAIGETAESALKKFPATFKLEYHQETNSYRVKSDGVQTDGSFRLEAGRIIGIRKNFTSRVQDQEKWTNAAKLAYDEMKKKTSLAQCTLHLLEPDHDGTTTRCGNYALSTKLILLPIPESLPTFNVYLDLTR